MFLLFSPSSFLFSLVYFTLIIFSFSAPDFVSLWVCIEFLMLTFIGLAYSVSCTSFSFIIVYFLIQTLSSFSILLFWSLNYPCVMCLFLIMNLALFPFHAWFLSVSYYFHPFLLFLSISFHNLPPLLLVLFHAN